VSGQEGVTRRRIERPDDRVAASRETDMTEYICLFRSTPSAMQAANATPERAKESMNAWLGWIRDLEASGNLANAGQPLDFAGKTVRGQDRIVTDGPYVEGKDLLLGYTIVRAADLDQAAVLAGGCPILLGGGSVEVRPVRQLM
jgi:hypothetical protein